MKLKNRYFILRHGDTVWSDKIVYPSPDSSAVYLNRKGEQKIKKAARELDKGKIDKIYSSDFYRAKQSAEIVAKELGLRIKFDRRLRDTNLGIYHGRPKKEFYADFPDAEKRFYKRPKNGESWNDVRRRLRKFLKDSEAENSGKNILLVGHGDPLWLLEGLAQNLTNQQLLKIILVETTDFERSEKQGSRTQRGSIKKAEWRRL